ncbi:hypothetical protein QAD02_011286 [Eretmocerus hayati]|uniref:Uncharacterized protein n=1 Tax=Eretmocerus hayati TaxID=131215 RepID=A0ACC2NWC0_9HYME|nr:hypothetical protein QAD02_011286 [Eretmocerus hayati]
MASCEISLTLLSTMVSLVIGDFHDTFGSFGLDSIEHKPWFMFDHLSSALSHLDDHHTSAVIPNFSTGSYDSHQQDINPIPTISSGAPKKVPKEDKTLKKEILPTQSTNKSKDTDTKEHDTILSTSLCYEIEPKESDTKAKMSPIDPKQMKCYRCKNPTEGSTYEHCSYSSVPESKTREPRSNLDFKKSNDSHTSATHSEAIEKHTSSELPEGFKFSDEYFHSAASEDLPVEYEKNIDSCERVVKDNMICMVCTDPNTNGKYEQCSYSGQPNDKAYAYSKSSSFGKPKKGSRDTTTKKAVKKPKNGSKPRKERDYDLDPYHSHYYGDETDHSDQNGSDEDDKEGHDSRTHFVPDYTHSHHSNNQEDGSQEAEQEEDDASPKQSANTKSNCRTVYKDGQSCAVCTDPKTGGKSKRCDYAYKPKDKAYKYSKSKSFGIAPKPRKGSNKQLPKKVRDTSAESAEKQEHDGSGESYGSYAAAPSSEELIRSESEKIASNARGQGNCRTVHRDSMVCTVCKDPKTGGDSEQCNYSYDPKDKVYAYSKSNSFGSPTKVDGEDDYGSYGAADGSGEEHPEETYAFPVVHPTGTSPLDYIPKSTTRGPKEEQQTKTSASRVDNGFNDAKVRRAEIEKIVKDIGAEDRSKCKKRQRGEMTCYKCTNEQGFTHEECVFVADPEQSTIPPSPSLAPASSNKLGVQISTAKPATSESKSLEPLKVSLKPAEPKIEPEELDTAEPYDYVAETRPVYDKVLGMTLPAYMVKRSPFEMEFDDFVEHTKF